MTENLSKGRPAKITARMVNDDTDPDTDRIVLWASAHYEKRLRTREEWRRAGTPTGAYTAFTPSYQFEPKWEADEDLGAVGAVNKAMERCLGSRGCQGWELWIQGDALIRATTLFRTEYIALEEKKDPSLRLLNLWAQDLLKEMKRM